MSSDAAYGTTDLIPLVKVDFLGRGRPEHIAYGPGGMWFARFKGISIEAKTTIWGPATEKAEPPIYSSTWVDLVEELRAAPNIPKDEGCVDFVTFGCHEQLIVRFENGNTLMYVTDDPEVRAKCSEGVITLVTERIADGWTVGNGTTLCQYDPEQYVIEWKKGTQTYYTFNIGTEENTTRVKNVVTLVGHDAAAQATMDSAAIVRRTFSRHMWNKLILFRFLLLCVLPRLRECGIDRIQFQMSIHGFA